MAIPCVKVASGGLPVTVASGAPFEISPSGFGIPVTVIPSGGLPITDATPGGGLGGGGGTTTFDPASASNVTLSGGNLKATHTGTATTGDGVQSISWKSTGKYYCEYMIGATAGNDGFILIAEGNGYYGVQISGGGCLGIPFFSNGNLYSAGSQTGALGVCVAGDVIGIAADLTARMGWVRKNNGNWNNSGTANPATGTGGLAMYASPRFAPAALFYGAPTGANGTANFGTTAFTYTVPSGFAGWPA